MSYAWYHLLQKMPFCFQLPTKLDVSSTIQDYQYIFWQRTPQNGKYLQNVPDNIGPKWYDVLHNSRNVQPYSDLYSKHKNLQVQTELPQQ